MSFDVETIYSLLPAIYRTRDAAIAETLDDLLTSDEQAQLDALRDKLAGPDPLTPLEQRDLARLEEKRLRGPLKALLTIIAEQAQALEENVDQLYDDQFIETCADWVVAYIADLVGYRALDPRLQERLGSARAEVANTVRFRRGKGTAAVLEQLALDVTGWDAAVIEFFQRLAVTQYLNHIRVDLPDQGPGAERAFDQPGTVSLRRADRLELAGLPFDPASHTVDVRRIAGSRGRYNIPNVGIFLWRVGSRQLTDSLAFQVDARRYLFSPLGANTQLYAAAERDPDVKKLAGPLDVPLPITRRALRRDLARLYGPGLSLTVQVGGQVLPLDEVEACDLSDTGPNPATSPWAHAGQTRVAIDPVLGRIAFPADVTGPVQVSYYYGSAADIGGGEYDRTRTAEAPPDPVRRVPADRPDAVQALADLAGAGTVEIGGSRLEPGLAALAVQANERLELRAADKSRPLVQLAGNLVISGGDSGEVTLNGLLIAGGQVTVPAQVNGQPNRLQKLRLVDCTLVPGGRLTRDGRPGPADVSLRVAAANVAVEIERCILGGLRVSEQSSVDISDSIVDGLGPEEVAYAAPDGQAPGGSLTVESCTFIGKVHTALLTASNSIFHARLAAADSWSAPVRAVRRQVGYVRYSYVPLDSQLPPRYACTPQDAQQAQQVEPRFTSLRYGNPAYGQLHAACPCSIRSGADDQGEMGVYHHQYAPQREAGLRVRLDEYLRFGLEAGLFFVS